MRFGKAILFFPIVYLLIDLGVRIQLIQLYSFWQLVFYAISVVTSIVLFLTVILFLNKIREKRFLYNGLLLFFCFYFVVTILGSYIFFYFNGFFPNYYTYAYFKNEPQSAFFLLKDTVKLQDIMMFLVSFSLVYLYMRNLTQKEIRWNSRIVLLIASSCYIGIFSFLVVKIKKYDQCLLVDTNFSAAVSSQLFNWDPQRKYKGVGLGYRSPFKLSEIGKKRDFNVLVIVMESMRKQNLKVYGYSRNTTPNLSAFQKEHPEEFFVFQHPYTVSTTTMLAVPAILTGIAPYQSPEIFYKQPILWEYSNMMNYRSFFISSQSLNWYRFDRFYANEELDHFWCQEKSNYPYFNDLGIDDKYTISHLDSLINEKNPDPFFGVVQLNSTHYPYTVPKQFLKWQGSYLDDYDNSILYQDHVLKELFAQLKKSDKLKNTVIVITSDHGESLKDHNNIGHVDSYYAETISVPLMLYLPDEINSKLNRKVLSRNLSRTTSNIDIAPTLLEIMGIEHEPQVKLIAQNFTGQSLFKLIPKDRTLITMNNNEIVKFKVGLSIIRDNLHYIYRTNIVPSRQELYDIKKDKRESSNFIDRIPKVRLLNLLNCFRKYPVCIDYLPDN